MRFAVTNNCTHQQREFLLTEKKNILAQRLYISTASVLITFLQSECNINLPSVRCVSLLIILTSTGERICIILLV